VPHPAGNTEDKPHGQPGAKTVPPQVGLKITSLAPKLPKLVAQVVRSGLAVATSLVDGTGSVTEAGGDAARHTRAWSVGAPAVVDDCRRLPFRRSRGASQHRARRISAEPA
jgi:hypothetical protein